MPVAEVSIIKDTIPFQYTIFESQEGDRKVFKVAGIFQKTNEKNENNRVYPDSLWEKIINDKNIQERIKRRRMLGEVEHPDDLQTKLSRVSHVITKLEKKGTEIWGEAEILDTPSGEILKKLFKNNIEVGISSRGRGTSTWQNNVEVVNDDYILETFDFVANPATSGAFPKPVTESVQIKDKEKDDMIKELEDIQERVEDIKLLVKKGLVESKRDKYYKDVIKLQTTLGKYFENPETKFLAEEINDTLKWLKKRLKEEEEFDKEEEEPEDELKDKHCPECGSYHDREKCPKKSGPPEEEVDVLECARCKTRLMLETNYSVYYCGNCQSQVPVAKALSKATLANKYVEQVKINRNLIDQAQSIREANVVLSKRLDSTVRTVSLLLNENKKLIVENYVLNLITKYPVLSKYKSQLIRCDSTACVDKQIELLQDKLVSDTKKTESVKIDKEKEQYKIESSVDKKVQIPDKKQIKESQEKKSNDKFEGSTDTISIAEKIYRSMSLF